MHSRSLEAEAFRCEALLRKARLAEDQHLISDAAEACARAYAAMGESSKEWDFIHIIGQSEILTGSYSAALRTSELLLGSPISALNPELTAKALLIRASALRNKSQHVPAIAAAREALTALNTLDGHLGLRAEAYQGLIASLVEAGMIDDAWSLREDLKAILDRISNSKVASSGYWTLGNLALAHGQHVEGLDYHDRAGELLAPTNDMHAWARFNKAIADVQLQAGIANDQTLHCIDRAQLAYGIIGGSESELVGLATTRARWNMVVGELQKASDILQEALGSASYSDDSEHVSVHLLWAQILTELGRDDEAQRERDKVIRLQTLAEQGRN
ncbi:hypothetical protein [Paeniglutamicibacter kerguelensis]|uniref:Tetratricopeptide (TPR) repeat protein n=1 Tax=Paeniglutamicibacter kerguelensis TaxID=254788 RepID=A0ABS4XJF4_9MICC|nr:hypothetical protein [Paeniglutamicibacter kerguelensis]MBP2388594.1 tetratricopeptide (TPR) repeat protein [Paeniglutamicibacter kerguelensis]